MAGRTGFDELIGDGEGVSETGAGGGHVKGRDPRHPEQPLQFTGGGREGIFGTGGGQHYHVQIGRRQARRVQCPQGSLMRQGGDGLVGPCDAAFTDPGTFHDPFVTGLNHLFKIGVGTHRARQVTASTQNFAMHRVLIGPCRKRQIQGDLLFAMEADAWPLVRPAGSHYTERAVRPAHGFLPQCRAILTDLRHYTGRGSGKKNAV
ncbi:hypothetical protein D3C78_1133570 [compost metagenome]